MGTVYDDIPIVSTASQAADVLGCSERMVRTLIANGQLEHVKLGRLVRVPRHMLVDFLESRKSDAAPRGDALQSATPILGERSARDTRWTP